MIHGHVSDELEAIVPVVVIGRDDIRRDIEAVIDTGFNGDLTLPSALIKALRLPYHGRATTMLGDGRGASMSEYYAGVVLDGVERDILALKAEGQPLIGMSLLLGSRPTLDVLPRGAVTIGAIPA